MNDDKLGRLEKVDLRTACKEESLHFTPWLAQEENLRLLGETLGMQLELVEQEKAVGRFVADILCKDVLEDSWVVIENQLEKTDHSHLGQILTYADGLEAATMIWIAPHFTEEHRAALDWLNEHTDEKTSFLGLEVELWRIGDSPPAPKFNIVSKPNDWAREVRATAAKGELSERRRAQLEFWTKFREYMAAKSKIPCQTPAAKHWMNHNVGWPGMWLASITSLWDSETGKTGPEIRVELYMSGGNAKKHFAQLSEQREAIEREVGQQLLWYNPEEKQMARIHTRRPADVLDRATWPDQFEWLRKNVELFYKVFAPRVKKLDFRGHNKRFLTGAGAMRRPGKFCACPRSSSPSPVSWPGTAREIRDSHLLGQRREFPGSSDTILGFGFQTPGWRAGRLGVGLQLAGAERNGGEPCSPGPLPLTPSFGYNQCVRC